MGDSVNESKILARMKNDVSTDPRSFSQQKNWKN